MEGSGLLEARRQTPISYHRLKGGEIELRAPPHSRGCSMMTLRILLCTLLLIAGPTSAQDFIPCQVTSVINGNTWRCSDRFTLRGWGYDSPEGSQPYGNQALQVLDRLINGMRLTCQRDYVSRDRIVGECWLPDGRPVGGELVRAGAGWDHPQFSRGRFAAEEKTARAARVGLWADPNPMPPWEWRKAHSGQ